MSGTAKTQRDLEGPACPADGLFGLDAKPEEAAVVLVPVPFDATASYRRGAAGGPSLITRASVQLDFFNPAGGPESPFPHHQSAAMLPIDDLVTTLNQQARLEVDRVRGANYQGIDEGFDKVNDLGAQLNTWVQDAVESWLDRGRVVGLVGGDHATALGAITAHAARYPQMAVLQFDAHADLRPAYEGFRWSHASVMHNLLAGHTDLRLFQVGVRDLCASEHQLITDKAQITTWFGPKMAERRFAGEFFGTIADEIVGHLPQEVYVSFDIDGLDPAFCPHTGTPVPGGLTFDEATFLLRRLVSSGRRIVGFDLVEVAPGPAGDEYDGNVAARLLFLLCRLALSRRNAVA